MNCEFCNKQVNEEPIRIYIKSAIMGGNPELIASMVKADSLMLHRKLSCAKCGSIYCFNCGISAGEKRGSSMTYCPDCGAQFDYEKLR